MHSKLLFFAVFEKLGLVRDLNPGPRAPEARIIPLDQRATTLGGHSDPIPIGFAGEKKQIMRAIKFSNPFHLFNKRPTS